MSISAMKQALGALEVWRDSLTDPAAVPGCRFSMVGQEAADALRQAIEQAEKQEPAFYVIPATDRFSEGYEQTYWEDPNGFPVYTRPVHASDISQERVDETPKCKDDPRAPHGFDRNASHSADRYVCECEGWEPPEIEPVQEDWYGQHQWRCGYERGWDKAMEAKREWVGLTDHELQVLDFNDPERGKLARAVEAKLKEKNCGSKD